MRFHVDPLTTLEEKARPAHAALLVVDMQNDFCAEGGAISTEQDDIRAVQEMVPTLRELLGAARAAGVLAIFTQNITSTDDNWYLSDVWLEQAARRRNGVYSQRWPCAPGSWGADFYEDIRPLPSEAVVTKHRFDAFLDTDLHTILRARRIRTVVFTGVATEVCVETTARSAFLNDYYVVIAGDATATSSGDVHRETLNRLDYFFGQVVSSADLIEYWRSLAADVAEPATFAADD